MRGARTRGSPTHRPGTAARVLFRVRAALEPAGACAALALAALLVPALAAFAAEPASRVPRPEPELAAPGKCVEDTPFMLRNHMELLKHHRDRTVREGVRTTQHSLANCVACHASPKTGRVTGSAGAFCESCHRYAAVSIDCFECHADRPPAKTAQASGAPR